MDGQGHDPVAGAQAAALGGAPGGIDAAEALVRAWAAEAPPGLVELHLGRWAADRRAGLRLLAVRCVGLAGPDARRALLELLVGDQRRDVRRLAAAEFAAGADLDRPADLERLRALLAAPDGDLTGAVTERLVARVAGWAGPAGEGVPALLEQLLTGQAARATAAALRGLGGWRPGSPLALPDVVARLEAGVGDGDLGVRQAAADAMAALAATVPAQGWALVRRLHAAANPRTRTLLERRCLAGALAAGMPRDEAWTWATEPAQRTRLALAGAMAGLDPGGPNWHRDLLRHLCTDQAPAVRAAAIDAAGAYAAEAWAARAARRNLGAGNRAVVAAAERLGGAVRRQRAG
jgi:hypothetical protein